MISKKILILGSKNIYHIVQEFSVRVFHGLCNFFLIKWPFNGENMEKHTITTFSGRGEGKVLLG